MDAFFLGRVPSLAAAGELEMELRLHNDTMSKRTLEGLTSFDSYDYSIIIRNTASLKKSYTFGQAAVCSRRKLGRKDSISSPKTELL